MKERDGREKSCLEDGEMMERCFTHMYIYVYINGIKCIYRSTTYEEHGSQMTPHHGIEINLPLESLISVSVSISVYELCKVNRPVESCIKNSPCEK